MTLDPTTVPRLEPKVQWSEARLRAEWSGWSEKQRDIYTFWFEVAKDYETEPLEAARFAAARVLMFARGTTQWPSRTWTIEEFEAAKAGRKAA